MLSYVLKRILYMIPVLLCVTVVVFSLLYITPGDPTVMILGDMATPEQYEALREEMGLNDGYLTRLGRYLKDLIFHFDLGNSYLNGQPVMKEILARYPVTLKLALLGVGFGLVFGLIMGVLSAIRQNSLLDNVCVSVSLFGTAAPIFWTGLLLIVIFSVKLKLLPATGSYGPEYWVMPVCVLGIQNGAFIARITRSSMLEVIRQDYIRTARAKGQREFLVILGHALRNAWIPILTVVGNQLCVALAGATVVETIFSLPGLGRYLIDSLNGKDYIAVQGVVLFIGVNCVAVNLIIDLLYAFVDPRVKANYTGKKLFRRRTKTNA